MYYIIGLAQNSRLLGLSKRLMTRAAIDYKATGQPQRRYTEFRYAAEAWDRERRVIARLQHTDKGANPRFIVTNLRGGSSTALYDDLYCARGDMENRIKEQQMELFSDRTSCHGWWPNQFHLSLSSIGQALFNAIRLHGLSGTRMARAQAGTIRLKLLCGSPP